jgi:REP element-mobilizing transposase RayT
MVHVWARRVERSALFVDDQDYQRYIALLKKTVERAGWIVLSFCLMPNHVHLLA